MGQQFGIGDTVIVQSRKVTHHHRIPSYIYGKEGRIEKIHGKFKNPEQLAYGNNGLPEQTLYSVLFKYTDVEISKDILPSVELMMDIFEHWLSPGPKK